MGSPTEVEDCDGKSQECVGGVMKIAVSAAYRSEPMFRFLATALLVIPSALTALELKSTDGARREFAFDGRVWRTSAFVDPAGKVLPVASEE